MRVLLVLLVLFWSASVAAATNEFGVQVSGSNTNLSLTANIAPSTGVGTPVQFFVGAVLADGTWFFFTPAGWQEWLGGEIPLYASGVLAPASIQVLTHGNVSSLGGTNLYVGYGSSYSAMVAGGTYAMIYTVPTDAARAAAATTTATGQPLCNAVKPFYWELGNQTGSLVFGSVGASAPGANTTMSIASASKWLYAAYAVEKKAGVLDPVADVPFLNFTSGYSNMPSPVCPAASGTVADCLAGVNGTINVTEAANAIFDYNSGHMQKHAANNGLGPLVNSTLATEIQSKIGADVAMTYTEPQLAGGAAMTATKYAIFLRKLLGSSPSLRIANMLGDNAVCTSTVACPTKSAYSPAPEAWHYGLGHWVEDDPASMPKGDGTFSSGGAFGFYPWVDATRTYYGVLAREVFSSGGGEGYNSVQCGRLIRLAWGTATPQTCSSPGANGC